MVTCVSTAPVSRAERPRSLPFLQVRCVHGPDEGLDMQHPAGYRNKEHGWLACMHLK